MGSEASSGHHITRAPVEVRRRARCREERARPVLQCAPVAALPAGGEAPSGSDYLMHLWHLRAARERFQLERRSPRAGPSLVSLRALTHSASLRFASGRCDPLRLRETLLNNHHSSGRSCTSRYDMQGTCIAVAIITFESHAFKAFKRATLMTERAFLSRVLLLVRT